MKYLLVLFLLIASPFTGRARPLSLPARLDLDASFAVASGNGTFDVFVTVAKWPDHARVALHIEEANSRCRQEGACGQRLLSGDGRALVPLADVVVARDLRAAAVQHGRPLHRRRLPPHLHGQDRSDAAGVW